MRLPIPVVALLLLGGTVAEISRGAAFVPASPRNVIRGCKSFCRQQPSVTKKTAFPAMSSSSSSSNPSFEGAFPTGGSSSGGSSSDGSAGSSKWINEDDLMRYAAAAEYSDLRRPSSSTAMDPSSPVPPRFSWSKNWYPLCVEAVTSKEELHAHSLLGRSIVLWWDHSGEGAWRCMTDACPHRLAPLSEGSITPAGGVRCAQHGWEFEGAEGTCTKIPQKSGRGGARSESCGNAFWTLVKDGIVWVWGDPLPRDCSMYNTCTKIPDASLMPLPPSQGSGAGAPMDMFLDLPFDYSTLMEASLDPSRAAFTHHPTLPRSEAGPLLFRMDHTATQEGFNASWMPPAAQADADSNVGLEARKGALIDVFDAAYGNDAEYDEDLGPVGRSNMVAPSLVYHSVDGQGSGATYAVPTRPGRCRVITRTWSTRKGIGKGGPLWWQHIEAGKRWEKGSVLLQFQEEQVFRRMERNPTNAGILSGGLSPKDVFSMPTTSDRLVKEFWAWMKLTAPVPWPRCSDKSYVYSEFDYYKQHTRQCKACSGALRQFRMMRPLVATAAAALLTMGRIAMTRLIPSAPTLVHSSAPLLLAVACGMLWRQIGVWELGLGGGKITGAAGHHEF